MVISDVQLGDIILVSNIRAKKIIARYRDGHFRITHPVHMKPGEIENVINKMRPGLMKLKENNSTLLLKPGSILKLSCFDVLIKESDYNNIYVKLSEGRLIILCPKDTAYSHPSVQHKLRSLIDREMTKEARRILPSRVEYFAKKYRFEYSSVRINKSITRWGSCSSRKNINLSFRCMLLPEHLIDLVILHELCHTREMNHGENFWKILDDVTEGESKTLTRKLNTFKSSY